jgi:hypothetical protein
MSFPEKDLHSNIDWNTAVINITEHWLTGINITTNIAPLTLIIGIWIVLSVQIDAYGCFKLIKGVTSIQITGMYYYGPSCTEISLVLIFYRSLPEKKK